MNCRQAYRFICDNLDESTTSARCRTIRKHIACCPRCRAYLDSVKKTVRLYRTAPEPGLSRTVHRDLMKALSVEMVQPPTRKAKPARHHGR
jgi:predicted anti-sigma-YlaC factor YlaD